MYRDKGKENWNKLVYEFSDSLNGNGIKNEILNNEHKACCILKAAVPTVNMRQ